MKAAYTKIRFRAELPEGGLPARFGIVTACNPNGVTVDTEKNAQATRSLKKELRREGRLFFPVAGGSPDFSHVEPGFGIVLDQPSQAVKIGKASEQDAVFWVEEGEVKLVSCRNKEQVELGTWENLAEPPANRPRFHFIGNLALLSLPKTALFSSAKCSSEGILRAHDQAVLWSSNGHCIISGFHSPVERECLRILLRGSSPIILCPARGLPRRIPANLRTAIAEGRLLLLSPFRPSDTRVSAGMAARRNEFVASLANEVWFAHVTRGGQMEKLARRIKERG